MKNSYFKEMRENGVRYRNGKTLKETRHGSPLPPYTEGQSYAFKFWAVAERYDANEIVVDDLPEEISEIPVMIDTLAAAGIKKILVKSEDMCIAEALRGLGYSPIRDSKVYSRETELHKEELIVQKGTLYLTSRTTSRR